MASKRVCVQAFKTAEGLWSHSKTASRNFSSQWTARANAPQHSLSASRTNLLPWRQQSLLGKYTSQPIPARSFTSTPASCHGHLDAPKPGEERHVTFVDKDGQSHTFTVADGDNLLDIAQANDLEMEGACGGSCACSTCHVIVDSEDMYDKMEEPDDDENDMLDLAFGLTETSRLGCQVKMSKELDGLVVRLPSMTRNLQASDFK